MKATQALSDPVDAAIIATDRHDAMRLTRTAARVNEDSNDRDRADDELHVRSLIVASAAVVASAVEHSCGSHQEETIRLASLESRKEPGDRN